MRDIKLFSGAPETTRALGGKLGDAILASDASAPLVIAFSGELGAGKTTFVGGLLRSMGVTGPVRSPTYTLIEPYEGLGAQRSRNVYHLDLYRLERAEDLDMLALRDLLQPGSVLLVEWAERGGAALPSPDVAISIRYPLAHDVALASQRELAITAYTTAGETLADKLVANPC